MMSFDSFDSWDLPVYPGCQVVWMLEIHGIFFPRHLTGVSGSAKLFPRFNLGRSQLEEVGGPQILSGFWYWFSPTKNGGDFSGPKFQGWKKKQWNPIYFRPFRRGGRLKTPFFNVRQKEPIWCWWTKSFIFFTQTWGIHPLKNPRSVIEKTRINQLLWDVWCCSLLYLKTCQFGNDW